MPDKRPTDNMELAVDLPQEEEFALANMMPYTYYNFLFLPKYQQEYADKYLLFDDITEKELKVFEEVFIKLIKISLCTKVVPLRQWPRINTGSCSNGWDVNRLS